MISKGYLQCEAEVLDPLKRDCKQNLYISDKNVFTTIEVPTDRLLYGIIVIDK